MRFQGIYAPLATPFDHRGNIYWSKLDHNLGQLMRTKLSGFLVCDRWGEGPLLSAEERVAIWRRVASQTGSAAQTWAAISGCGVSEARSLVAAAKRAGCSCAVLEAPDLGAIAPGADAADLFFRAVADTSDLPLLASVEFGDDGQMRAERLAALAAHPAISGALVEGFPAEMVEQAAAACGTDFAIVVRDLQQAAPCLARGARAAVLTIAAAVPFFALSIEEAVRTRETEAARDLTARALDFDQILRSHGVPALKHALDLRNSYGGPPRLPLLGAAPATAEAISLALRELVS